MSESPNLSEIFLDVQRGLPRQGPGSDESTLRALALCGDLPEGPAILDIGCGPGMQTVALARAVKGRLTAVDINNEYLGELRRRTEIAGLAGNIEILAADMNAIPVAPGSFDAVWSEGAAYIMEIEKALSVWRRFLRPGGYIAITELVWLHADPPAEVAAFFGAEYPPMTEVASITATLRTCGYQPVGHFTLPDRAWWDHYYAPLEAKLPGLYEKYRGDPEALRIVETTAREIEMRRRFSDYYGYEFFVGRKRG